MKPAVIYARYSCDNQNEQSIEGQMRVCRSYAESHDMMIVHEYIDRAMSGTNDARPAFQQMIRDSAQREWQAVLVYKLDRFSRNKYESTIHKKTLRDRGIAVVSAMENIPESPEGIILESLLEGMNQYYSMELAQKVKRGMKENFLKGLYMGGHVPYGYYAKDKRVYAHETESKVAQEIFFKYAQGYTVPEIIDSLTARGIRFRNGQPFTMTYIYRMFTITKYIGILTHDGETYDNVYPRLISEEIWEKVQRRHKENAVDIGVKSSSNYLLSGKLYCGHCCRPMVGLSAYGCKHKKYYYYACHRPREKVRLCDMKTIDRDTLHDKVFNTVCRLFATNETIQALADMILKEHSRACRDNTSLQVLEAQLESTNRAIDNIMKAIEAGIITDQTKSRIEELNRTASQLRMDINLEKARLRPDLELSEVLTFLRSQFYGETQDNEIRKALLKTFVRAVIYDGDKIIVSFNYQEQFNPAVIPPDEIRTLIAVAEEKGVVFNDTAFFFTSNSFGTIVPT